MVAGGSAGDAAGANRHVLLLHSHGDQADASGHRAARKTRGDGVAVDSAQSRSWGARVSGVAGRIEDALVTGLNHCAKAGVRSLGGWKAVGLLGQVIPGGGAAPSVA